LVVKNGPNKGQPRVDYFVAVAIKKEPGHTHFAQAAWGRIIWDTAVAAFPQGQSSSPTFAWKIVDGDSAIPNKRGIKPCDREGYPGHWIVSMSSGYASKIYNADGSQQIVTPDAVKCGYFIQVAGSVGGNDSMQQPGVFVNHNMIALAGYGPEIVSGPDPKAIGFGTAPLPAGASAIPLSAGFNPAVPAPGVLPPALPALPVIAPVLVAPNPAFLSAPLPPSLPTLPVSPVARLMTPLASGASYEQMIAAGWTDALLLQHGMVAA
jgi:hypothetical protein